MYGDVLVMLSIFYSYPDYGVLEFITHGVDPVRLCSDIKKLHSITTMKRWGMNITKIHDTIGMCKK